jgi:hypothetical protein
MDDKVVSLIEKFYDNPANVSKNFGGPENFIKFVLSKGDKYSEYLDPKNEFFYENDLQDLLIWEKYQAAEDKQQFLREFVVEFLDSDMDVESGGKISWVIDKDDVLLAFDDSGRDGTARNAAEMVFNEDFNEHFSDVITDFYDDCIRTLNDKNESLLANKIVSELPPLTSDEIKETPFLEELWEIEGQGGFLTITSDNIAELLGDDDTTEYIITNFFPDLKSDMINAYWNAYNVAYENELSKEVYEGIEGFFGDSGKMIEVGKDYKGNSRWKYEIDVTKTFEYLFKEYFSDWKNHYNPIEYFGSFGEMLNQLFDDGMERIDFRIPDYPDYSEVESAYNEYVEI